MQLISHGAGKAKKWNIHVFTLECVNFLIRKQILSINELFPPYDIVKELRKILSFLKILFWQS